MHLIRQERILSVSQYNQHSGGGRTISERKWLTVCVDENAINGRSCCEAGARFSKYTRKSGANSSENSSDKSFSAASEVNSMVSSLSSRTHELKGLMSTRKMMERANTHFASRKGKDSMDEPGFI